MRFSFDVMTTSSLESNIKPRWPLKSAKSLIQSNFKAVLRRGKYKWNNLGIEPDGRALCLRALAAILRSKLESNFAALNARLNVTRQDDEAKREYQLLQLVLAWMEAEAEACPPFRLR
jgi:hypothetical protein